MADDRKRVRWLPSVAVGLAVLGVILIWAAPATPETSSPPPPAAPSDVTRVAPSGRPLQGGREPAPAQPAQVSVRDEVTGLILPESDPVTLSIPRIDARSRLVNLGLDSENVMEVPRNPGLAGWFSRGATPGALGPAVIVGHVTWDGTPAIFYRLGALRRGDQVTVSRKDGRTAVFTITKVAQYAKSRFPSRAVYGAIDHAGLRLITCGGTYDAARHRYLDNVVVFARLQSVRESRG